MNSLLEHKNDSIWSLAWEEINWSELDDDKKVLHVILSSCVASKRFRTSDLQCTTSQKGLMSPIYTELHAALEIMAVWGHRTAPLVWWDFVFVSYFKGFLVFSLVKNRPSPILNDPKSLNTYFISQNAFYSSTKHLGEKSTMV